MLLNFSLENVTVVVTSETNPGELIRGNLLWLKTAFHAYLIFSSNKTLKPFVPL